MTSLAPTEVSANAGDYTLTSENAPEFSSSPNYNACRQIILRSAKHIRLKELKHDYP